MMDSGLAARGSDVVSVGPRRARAGTRRSCALSVVVPALNEAANLPVLFDRLAAVLGEMADFEMIVVDDGSTDDTLATLRRMAARDPRLIYLSFSRNFGHQPALRAGIERAAGRCVVTMDADLQHPPEVLAEMLGLWRKGFQVVQAVRLDETRPGWFKRVSSRSYYRLINWLGGLDLEAGSSDFRLLDRKVVEALRLHGEVSPFLRGLTPGLGFRRAKVSYVPADRLSGRTKFSLGRMIALALDGVLATSIRPLRLATLLAGVMSLVTAIYAVYVLWVSLVLDIAIPGWTSVILVVSMVGALQLLVLGIIGEYLGRVLQEVRHRPAYIVEETNAGEDRERLLAEAAR
jgi:dolichol-phosphate mannosyltransferase